MVIAYSRIYVDDKPKRFVYHFRGSRNPKVGGAPPKRSSKRLAEIGDASDLLARGGAWRYNYHSDLGSKYV
jgi:hypothetical protein